MVKCNTRDMRRSVEKLLSWIVSAESREQSDKMNPSFAFAKSAWGYLSGEVGDALWPAVSVDDKNGLYLKEALGILLDKATENLENVESTGKLDHLVDMLQNREICLQAAYDACLGENLNEVKRALKDFLVY